MEQRSGKAKRVLLSIAAIGAIGLLAIQFVRPEIGNPPVTAEIDVPADVKQILRTSCYNCHSNEVKLAWFDYPAPAIWIVAQDVREARKHLNFSEIGKLALAQQRATLFEAVSQIHLGAMPLPSYRFAHPESAITPEKLGVLKRYLTSVTPDMPATMEQAQSADGAYRTWTASGDRVRVVAPAPNGVAFEPDYKNWRPISTTERFDNHTTRLILGNDVAIRAIAENRIDPWPDGTAFAKVAWQEVQDEQGAILAGEFFQVEFMRKDSKKYANTLGWAWSRWRGTDLKPYGKDEHFTSECVSCHLPLKNTDYVFTMPMRGQQ